MFKINFHQTAALFGMGLVLGTATGCGKQAFQVTTSTAGQTAPGNYYIPPKVDILLVEDDTGSMAEAYSQIAAQVPTLLNDLQGKGWDYHFTVVPLTNPNRDITEVMASRYDLNWGAEWLEPFPGAMQGTLGMITPSVFRRPENFSQFLTRNDLSSQLNGQEPGFATIADAFNRRLNGTGFLRQDAMLAIVVMGNGNDTSGITYRNSYGSYYPVPDPASEQASFEDYKNQFLALKGDPAAIKFYAAVSKRQGSCLGGQAFIGTRYINMATSLGGQAFDICSSPVKAVLDGLSTQLQAEKKTFRMNYLFVGDAPDPASIEVVKYVGGDENNTQVIPNDPDNGWTYEGFLENQAAIDFPIPMNFMSGYAIQLHGTARLTGDDRADVTYKPEGAVNSQ